MDSVEQRLRTAAEETRQLARERWPGRFVEKRPTSRLAWRAFAAAFAAVALTFSLVPWLVGNGQNAPLGNTPPLSAPVDTQTTVETDATVDTAGDSRSSEGIPAPGQASDLPGAVDSTRTAIIEAATACDLVALEALAIDGFTTNFGGGGVENLALWEAEGDGQLGTLLRLLDLSSATIDTGQGGEVYVWPAAFAYENWEDIPEDLMNELRQIYTEDELDQIALLGSYGGWRTGIDENGNWLYLVSSD